MSIQSYIANPMKQLFLFLFLVFAVVSCKKENKGKDEIPKPVDTAISERLLEINNGNERHTFEYGTDGRVNNLTYYYPFKDKFNNDITKNHMVTFGYVSGMLSAANVFVSNDPEGTFIFTYDENDHIVLADHEYRGSYEFKYKDERISSVIYRNWQDEIVFNSVLTYDKKGNLIVDTREYIERAFPPEPGKKYFIKLEILYDDFDDKITPSSALPGIQPYLLSQGFKAISSMPVFSFLSLNNHRHSVETYYYPDSSYIKLELASILEYNQKNLPVKITTMKTTNGNATMDTLVSNYRYWE